MSGKKVWGKQQRTESTSGAGTLACTRHGVVPAARCPSVLLGVVVLIVGELLSLVGAVVLLAIIVVLPRGPRCVRASVDPKYPWEGMCDRRQ